MLIKNLAITNYFSFKERTVLDCSQPVTVIAGRNNSGKTHLLEAIVRLLRLADMNASQIGQDLQWAYATFGREGGTTLIEAELDATVGSAPFEGTFTPTGVWLRLEVEASRQDAKAVIAYTDHQRNMEEQSVGPLQGRLSQGEVVMDFAPLGEALRRIFTLRAERGAFVASPGAVGQYQLTEDGANVVQVLNAWSARDPHTFASITTHLRRLLPGTESILAPLADGGNIIRPEVREAAFSTLSFLWEEMASGARNMVALVTLLVTSPDRSLLLIEEPELFMHPQATVDLFQLCGEVAAGHDKQIVMTTHSPLVMELAGTGLNVVARNDAGESSIVKLTTGAERGLRERGVMKSFMLAPYQPGVIPAGLLIVEGDDDEAAWSQWLATAGLAERGVIAVKGGAGDGDAINLALYMAHLRDAGIRSGPFLLVVDADGPLDRREGDLKARGLKEIDFHVLRKGELEDYLLNAEAISSVLDGDVGKVSSALARKRGKEGLNLVLQQVFGRSAADSTLKGLIASRIEPYDDLLDVIEFFNLHVAVA